MSHEKLRRVRLVALTSLLVILQMGVVSAQIEPEADSILRRCFEVYRTTPAFACKGECIDSDATSPDRRCTMQMIFSRLGRFRLAWTEPGVVTHKTSTEVIFTRGGETLFHWESDESEERYGSLPKTIAACAGISHGLSNLLPGLLLGEPGQLGEPEHSDIVSLRRAADARSTDGHLCWQLAMQTKGRGDWELLIDQKDYALRQAARTSLVEPITAMQVRAALAKKDPRMADAPLPPARTVHSLFRFTEIQFAGSWPESAFELADSKNDK